MSFPAPIFPNSESALKECRNFFAVTSPLGALAIVVFSWRIYTKLNPAYRMGWDDWCMVFAFFLVIVDWVILAIPLVNFLRNNRNGIGFPQVEFGYTISFFGVLIWTWVLVFIKTSVGFTLLRFFTKTRWRICIWAIIVLLFFSASANTIFLFTKCHPVQNAWHLIVPPGSCPPMAATTAISTMSSINIATDLILSFSPLAFLLNLHRPLRERILLIVLMATGLAASAASIRKTQLVLQLGEPVEEQLAKSVAVSTWSMAEEFISVVAACMPMLKPLFQKLLDRMGVSIGWDSERSASTSKTRSFFRSIVGRQSVLRSSQPLGSQDVASVDKQGKQDSKSAHVVQENHSVTGSADGLRHWPTADGSRLPDQQKSRAEP